MKDIIINDKHLTFKPFNSVCSDCKYFNIELFNCKAFEKGIPDEILDGSNKHSNPLDNQKNNIVFTKK